MRHQVAQCCVRVLFICKFPHPVKIKIKYIRKKAKANANISRPDARSSFKARLNEQERGFFPSSSSSSVMCQQTGTNWEDSTAQLLFGAAVHHKFSTAENDKVFWGVMAFVLSVRPRSSNFPRDSRCQNNPCRAFRSLYYWSSLSLSKGHVECHLHAFNPFRIS